jgi:lipopolysaccharide transport system ATP-binding protein
MSPDDERRIAFSVRRTRSDLDWFYPSAHLISDSGVEIAQMDGRLVGCRIADAEQVVGELAIRGPWLKPGRYHVDLFLCSSHGVIDAFDRACEFTIAPVLPYPGTAGPDASAHGTVLADYRWSAHPAATPDVQRTVTADV